MTKQRTISMKGSFVSNSSRRTDTKRDTNTEVSVEEVFLKGLPPINLGALFMPPIWGPAHGIWITILYYPAWLVLDNLFYGAYENPQPLSIVLSIIA